MIPIKRLVVALSVVAFAAQAVASYINDNYIGADGNNNDVMGGHSFQIAGMDVSYDTTQLTVAIRTGFDEPRESDITFGDLFISIDGWNPFGEPKYLLDDASNGESWEYAFNTSEGDLVDLSGAVVLLTDDEMQGHYPINAYRNG